MPCSSCGRRRRVSRSSNPMTLIVEGRRLLVNDFYDAYSKLKQIPNFLVDGKRYNILIEHAGKSKEAELRVIGGKIYLDGVLLSR